MPSRKNASQRDAGRVFPESIPPHWLSLGLLTVLRSLAYANSLWGKFVFDDLSVILQNPTLMNIKKLSEVMAPVGGGWRRLLFATYALNYYWGGLDTFGYHLVNVALHVINVLLIYGIILSLFQDEERSRYVALGGAAVFGVHTLLSGAVSYIAGRSSVLCATFYFAAVYLFFRGLNSKHRPSQLAFFGLTAVAGLLAWEAKQEAITLPVFLAAVVLLRARKINWRWIAALSLLPLLLVVVMWDRLK